uniref:Ankyrin repeat protein n=1 Tax=viral metagenome TaxID=1070528 RepID=A0A6C0IUX7_9ZZZZ
MEQDLKNGDIDEIIRLHTLGGNNSKNAMDMASRHGHLDIVKFLHSIGKHCTMHAMNWALENKHFHILKHFYFLKTKNVYRRRINKS